MLTPQEAAVVILKQVRQLPDPEAVEFLTTFAENLYYKGMEAGAQKMMKTLEMHMAQESEYGPN
jgi:hypothetical protein